MRLKERIKNWLFSEELKTIENIKNENEYLYNITLSAANAYNYAKEEHKRAKKLSLDAKQLTEDCQKMMNQICDVGTDVGFRSDDHSWAVVCVKGKPEYIKFVPLGGADTREIINFLKRFQYSNHIIDSPFRFRDVVADRIFDWRSCKSN